jgi:glucosamine--fructose-6-phosphate aminotransferase (isomerizing)
MCGIVGYIGKQQAYPILTKGLHRLEYRGYDSAGVALLNGNGQLNVYKAKGKVSELEAFAEDKDLGGTVGIAHTRWATHGEPNVKNAHPHCSESEQLALIHNGIIENYESLRQMLLQEGLHFRSDTDTEVLVQLIEYLHKKEQTDLLTAVRHALQRVSGAYAIAVIERSNPDLIVAARKGSPLVVGVGEGELFLASDATPIVEYTQNIVYIGDEQVVALERGKEPKVLTLDNREVPYEVKHLSLSIDQLEKGGFDHFMLKEIFEQPVTLRAALQGGNAASADTDTIRRMLPDFDLNKERFLNAQRIIVTACGTSWHAGLIAKYAFEEFARIPCEVDYSSEFRYRRPVVSEKDMVIAISQSGETADTLAAIELAKQQGAFILSVCNVQGSSIPRLSDSCLYTHAGPEIGVASTKAFTSQVIVLTMLALAIGREKGSLPEERFLHLTEELQRLPQKAETVLQQNDTIRAFASTYTFAHDAIYLGRGYNFPVALEGALKLKEISYIHSEGYPAGEMKHGPIALVSPEMPVVVIATQGNTYEKVVSNILEIKARKGRIISVVTEGDTQVRDVSEFSVTVPATDECLSPILNVIPLQLLSYHVAVSKGCDVDQPRNLAKSVTVE